MKPTLFLLAAGMGSRYGGLKQLDGLGPNGETIMDYSIYDEIYTLYWLICVLSWLTIYSNICVRKLSPNTKVISLCELVFQSINNIKGWKVLGNRPRGNNGAACNSGTKFCRL